MPTPSTPFVGLGTQLQFATVAAPTVFTTLAGVQGVTFSGDKVSTDKTTNMQTPNGIDTYIAGTTEPGTCDVKAQFLRGDASHLALLVIKNGNLAVNFQALYPGGGFDSFSGIVESYTPAIPLDKLATVDIKIKITGPIVNNLS
jgi:hypothetical protein